MAASRHRASGDRIGRRSDRVSEDGPSGGTALTPLTTAQGMPASSLARELHLTRTRARELEVRVDELGDCLLDAEQRAADLLRVRAQLAETELKLSNSQAALERSEHWLAHLKATSSWRYTAPLRAVKLRARALIRR